MTTIYHWKKRYALITPRFGRYGYSQRYAAAEERLARRVYKELLQDTRHPHLANPCHGHDPRKVIAGRQGRNAYILTGRALLRCPSFRAFVGREGLDIREGHEFVPLLRMFTDPKTGHFDLPPFIRYVVELYYIYKADPSWLFDRMPFNRISKKNRASSHYLSDLLAFYLFRPVPIRCPETGKSVRPLRVPAQRIFDMVERKYVHILRSIKDEGDRARWTCYMGRQESRRKARLNNLDLLYSGYPDDAPTDKLVREYRVPERFVQNLYNYCFTTGKNMLVKDPQGIPTILGRCSSLPHPETPLRLYVAYFLGAIRFFRNSLSVDGKDLSIWDFARKYREQMRNEVAKHAIIRIAVLMELRHYEEYYFKVKPRLQHYSKQYGCPMATRLYEHYLICKILGVETPRDILQMGYDYFKRTRALYRQLCNLEPLYADEAAEFRDAYRARPDVGNGRVCNLHSPEKLEKSPAGMDDWESQANIGPCEDPDEINELVQKGIYPKLQPCEYWN